METGTVSGSFLGGNLRRVCRTSKFWSRVDSLSVQRQQRKSVVQSHGERLMCVPPVWWQ
jgi:hypothetical protein